MNYVLKPDKILISARHCVQRYAHWGASGAVLNGEGGNNTLICGTGNDTFQVWSHTPGTEYTDYIQGGGGTNTLDYSQSPGPVSVNLMGGQASDYYGGADYFSDIQAVVGSAFNDTLVSDQNVILAGGGGNNIFDFPINHANGATVTDFVSGTDQLEFDGFGTSAASFVQDTSTTWTVNSSNGMDHETITFSNAPTILPSDFHFV